MQPNFSSVTDRGRLQYSPEFDQPRHEKRPVPQSYAPKHGKGKG